MPRLYVRRSLLLMGLACLGGAPLLLLLLLRVGALPLQEGEEPYPWEWAGSRSAACEACQAIAELLSSRAVSVHPHSSSSNKSGTGSSSVRGLPSRGAGFDSQHSLPLLVISLERETREDAERWLKRRQQAICQGGLLQPYAEQTEALHEAALAGACESLFREKRDTLLRLYHSQQYPPLEAAAAAELCLPAPCESLWGEEDRPPARLPQALRNLRDSQLFLAANKHHSGVQTLESGLQIRWIVRRQEETLEDEDLPPVSPCDSLAFSLEALLKDGTVLFSTKKSGRFYRAFRYALPAGWQEAAELMKKQEVLQVFLSPSLAYGAEGYTGFDTPVGPFAAVLLQLRLEGISPSAKAPEACAAAAAVAAAARAAAAADTERAKAALQDHELKDEL
ncbi:hypothetical protein Efla_006427 [Eimeria flavescens]